MVLPDAVRLGRVRLAVSSLARSLAFYQNVIGFRLLASENRAEQPVAYLGAAGSDEVLLELEEQPTVRPLTGETRLGLYHFAVLLPDRATLGSFAVHLRNTRAAAGSADHMVSEAFYLVDPDGLTIEVYADRLRSTWRYRQSQLVMATDPIAMNELLELGSHSPWQGLPAGTHNGHIHFYGDNLAAADAFYHQALGFEKTVWSFPSALFMAAGGYHHHVAVNTWAAGSAPASIRDPRLLSWELQLPDERSLEDLQRRLAIAGVDLQDPWGNTLVLALNQNYF